MVFEGWTRSPLHAALLLHSTYKNCSGRATRICAKIEERELNYFNFFLRKKIWVAAVVNSGLVMMKSSAQFGANNS